MVSQDEDTTQALDSQDEDVTQALISQDKDENTTQALASQDENWEWSTWTQWSQCSQSCDGGMQWRNRTCSSLGSLFEQDEYCPGHQREGRTCNTLTCLGTWSCWSAFTPCSVTCGLGLKRRSRQCQSSDIGIPCIGQSVQQLQCRGIAINCQSSQTKTFTSSSSTGDCTGWKWSDWTPCIGQSGAVQYRHRSQSLDSFNSTSVTCSQTLEIRSCDLTKLKQENTDDLKVRAVKSSDADIRSLESSSSIRRLGVLYLVVTAIISFILGGVVCIGLYLYIQHHRKQQRKEEALWMSNVPYSHNICWSSSPSDNQAVPLPKMNNVNCSQDSLEMRMQHNLSELNQYDAFGSLRKGKVTVSEASTLKRNTMWTNLSIHDDKY